MMKNFLLFFYTSLKYCWTLRIRCCTENTNAINGRRNEMFLIDVWILSGILT